MKKYLLFFLFSLLLADINAQPFNVDSLRKKIETSKADTTRIKMLGVLSSYYNHNHLDSGFYFVQQMITLSQKLKYPYGEAWGLSILSTAADRTGDMAKSLELALSCLHQSEKLTYKKEEMIYRANTQLGVVNFLMGRYEEARTYLRTALGAAKNYYPDETSYYQIYAHIGNSFRRQRTLDSAFFYIEKAYALSLKSKEVFFFPYVRNCEGDINDALNKRDIAKQFYLSAIAQGIKVNHQFQLSYSYSRLSALYNNTGMPDSCIYFAKKSLDLSQQYYFGTFIPDATNQLALAFEKLHQPDSALKYLRVMMDVKDRTMNLTKQQQFQLLEFEEQQRKEKLLAENREYINKVRTIVFIIALVMMLAVISLLYRNNRAKQKSNVRLTDKTNQLENAMENLQQTQVQLIQSEKMASLGELTAGIAHEIQNPLNFVNNFSEVNKDLIEEMKQELTNGNLHSAAEIANDILGNSEKINHHGKRADAIVKNMLQHSQKTSTEKELTDINMLVDEYFRLAYHGLRSKDKNFNATLKTDFDKSIEKIKIIPQDIGRVILNLVNNAFYAVNAKTKQNSTAYEPTVEITTKKINDTVQITVRDNGTGISPEVVGKIFQPFFTTKPAGQGTGLGLSLAYDIVKAHNGTLTVHTGNSGTAFTLLL